MKNFGTRCAIIFIAVLLTACGNALLKQAKGGWLGERITDPPFSIFGEKQEPIKTFIFVEIDANIVD